MDINLFRTGPRVRDMLKAGFIQHVVYYNLFTHPALPGLLFKRVNDVKEALQYGGVLCVGATAAVGYVGRTMWRALDGDRLGEVRIASALGADAAGAKVREGSADRPKYRNDVYISVKSWVYVPAVESNCFAVAIVSKASDGHVVTPLRGDGGVVVSSDAPFQEAIARHTFNPYSGYTGLVLALNAGEEGDKANTVQIRRSGFMAMADDLPLRALLQAAKPLLVETVDEGVRDVYDRSYDDALDEVAPASEQVQVEQQGPALFLWSDGTWRNTSEYHPVIWTNGADMTMAHESRVNLYSGPINAGAVSGLPFVAAKGAFIGTAHELLYGDDVTDLPPLDYQVVEKNGGKPWRKTAASSQIVVPSAVSYPTCKLSLAQTDVPASAVIPRMLPVSAPAAEPAAGTTLDLVVHRQTVLLRADPLSGRLASVPTMNGSPATQQEMVALLEVVDSALGESDERRKAAQLASNKAGAFIGSLVAFDTRLDELVRDAIG